MRYYAHYGHKDFVLCLGYGAQHIKDYFLNYAETASNDFVLRSGRVELLGSDIQDWNITFVHTGVDSPIGERLRRVRSHVQDEEMFLANYADVLTDAPLNDMIDTFKASDAAGAMLAVRPQSAFHCIEMADDNRVTAVRTLQEMPLRENGGYFVLRPEVIDMIPSGGDLVTRRAGAHPGLPLRRVLATGRHPQRAGRPRGRLPVRDVPLDGVGRDQGAGRGHESALGAPCK